MRKKIIRKLKNTNIYKRVIGSGIIKNSIITLSSQTIAGALSFFTTLIIVATVGVTGNGVLAIVITYSTMFNGLFNFQSYNALIKFGAEAIEKKDNNAYKMYIKTALIQDIVTAILAYVIGKAVLGYIAEIMHWDANIVSYINLYLITIPINITGSLNAILRLHDKFHITGLVSIVGNFVKFILAIFAFMMKLTVYYFVWIEIILIVVQNVLRLYYSLKTMKERDISFDEIIHTKLYMDKKFTKFNIYNNLVSAVDIPAGQAVNLVINKYLGMNTVGVYNIFVKAGAIIAQITDAVGQAIFPEFSVMVAKNNIKAALSVCKKLLKSVNLLSIIAAILSLLFYKMWMPFFMEPNFNYAVAFAIYILFLGLSGSLVPIHQLFVSVNLVNYNLYIAIVCNIIYILLLLLLSNILGLIGVMIAMLFQCLLVCVCKIIILRRKQYWM